MLMEGHATGSAAEARSEPALGRDLALLALLLLVAIGLRVWHLTHTEVAARDSIGYIRYAWQLGHHSWREAIGSPRQEQHPGYPLAILAVSYPVRLFISEPDTRVMQLSAQLASSLASVLLVVPMYFLGRDLFHRGVGFWTALSFQCLPAAGRVFADGLSEGVFLLFAATALLGAVRAFRNHRPLWFALTGLAGGLAYLTRPEGALIVAATGLVLLAVQCLRSRPSWRRFLACGAALTITAATVGGPFILLTGKLTVKPTGNQLFHNALAPGPELPVLETQGPGDVLASPPFAVWNPIDLNPTSHWALEAVGIEFAKGCHFLLWIPMGLGLWWFRDRFRLFPGACVLLLVSLAILTLMWRVASLLGYVSDRHLLLPILCGTPWAVAFVPKLVTGPAAILRWLRPLARLGGYLPAAAGPVWPTLLLAGFVALTLPKTLESLHANRSGFRDAGVWIAQHGHPWDEVIDPYSWTHYYAGRVFLEDQSPAPPVGQTKVCYVVLEVSGREHPHPRLDIQGAMRRAAAGHKVKEWTRKRNKETIDVIVYQTQP
jgi:hypothetical protein